MENMSTIEQSADLETVKRPIFIADNDTFNEAEDYKILFYQGLIYTLFAIMDIIGHILQYFLTPAVILTHGIVWILLWRLTREGTDWRSAVRAVIVHEVVTYVFWWAFPDSLGSILATFLGIYMYETLYGPKVIIQENAQIITDDNLSAAVREACPSICYESVREGATFRISTNLQYIVHTADQWWRDKKKNGQDILLSRVKSVHGGCDNNVVRTVRALGAENPECFYVALDDDKTNVTFITPDAPSRDQWLKVFKQLSCQSTDNIKTIWFEKACKDSGVNYDAGSLDLEDVERLLTTALRPTDKCYLIELVKVICTSGNAGNKGPVAKIQAKFGNAEMQIDPGTLTKLFDAVTFKPEIEIVFEKVLQNGKLTSSYSSVLDTQRFLQFLKDRQKEQFDLESAEEFAVKHETVLTTRLLSSVGFSNYMISPENSVFKHSCRTTVYQDMDQPINHYFISTSHNTYLTKDQLKSKSSVEMYAKALQRGCRCVELDTWDGPNNEPVIYHGRTLTSKILFKDVIQAVKEHAFSASEYPVILSFENHCSVEQQRIIASHLINILGPMLYRKQIPEDEKQYPSPNDLKGYVLVKYKKLRVGMEDEEESSDEESDDEYDDDVSNDGSVNGSSESSRSLSSEGSCHSEKRDERREDEDSVSLNSEDVVDDEESGEKRKGSVKNIIDAMRGIKGKKTDKKKPEAPKIAQELSDLVIYCQSVKFKGFEHSRENNQYYEMSSIGEKKVLKLLKEDLQSFLKYTYRQICRIYPAANRIVSSNYDPQIFWNVGTQMVALNFQTHDRYMQLHQGLFQDNGGCGYILKPDFMLKDDVPFNPRGSFDTFQSLMIQVISGHQLPYSTEKQIRTERGLHVLVRISGVDVDNGKDKTKTVKSNGFHVLWQDSLKVAVHVPELAIVQFVLREGSDTFLGQYTVPVRCMQQGYRNIPLWTKASVPIPYASLFVHIEMSD